MILIQQNFSESKLIAELLIVLYDKKRSIFYIVIDEIMIDTEK